MKPEQHTPLKILLADDDTDDCFFFNKALKEISIATHLTTIHDGEQLMKYLSENSSSLPDILFLDISMPRKTGFECLTEIKENEKLKVIPVVMFSTSFPRNIKYEQDMIKMCHKIGALDYIRKPGDFANLKQVIHKVLIMAIERRKRNGHEGNL